MPAARSIQFDGWVLRRDQGQLTRDGRKIRLQAQPLQILDELLTHPGELVTREQLIARLWPNGVVDFDTSLNSAVRKLRVALRDDAETPRYIETIPRKGYRFVGTLDPCVTPQAQPPEPVPRIAAMAAPQLPQSADLPESSAQPIAGRNRPVPLIYVAAGIIALLILGLLTLALRHDPPTPVADKAVAALNARSIAVLPFDAGATDQASALLALSVADIVRNRLAMQPGWTVIGSSSTAQLARESLDDKAAAAKLHAGLLLKGSVARAGNQLRVTVQLVDAASGSRLWSSSFERPGSELDTLRDEVFGQVAATLQAPIDATASVGHAINLDAYLLYMQGQRLIANLRADDNSTALELFRRATTLDPGFARGHLALAQACILASALGNPGEAHIQRMQTEAEEALNRSLQLDPALGEAWIERARFTPDPSQAEQMFRKGLELAPSYGMGYMRYAEFLFDQYRKGEAIGTMDRARQIDPLNARLHMRQAHFVMVGRSDVAEHERLLREALSINPRMSIAVADLAHSRHEYTGDFAEAIRLMEQTIALDPQAAGNAEYAATMYLDVGDPEAAAALLREINQPSAALVDLAQYQQDHRRAAQMARTLDDFSWNSPTFSPPAEAIRDEAIATGGYAAALKLLESRYAVSSPNQGARGGTRMWDRGLALVYAHTLMLAGETDRARALVTALLVQIDSESVGRTENWFARERAMAYTLLGDDERALSELASSLKLGHYARWWYTAELNPIYDRLRRDPRFQALADQARKHQLEQRALVDVMRQKGEIPRRGS